MAEEETGEQKEGESEEPDELDPSTQQLSPSDFPDDVELEFAGESIPKPPKQGEASPEVLGLEIVEELEDPSEESPPEKQSPLEGEESVEEEEQPETETEEEMDTEAVAPEDLAREVTEELEESQQEETGEEPSPSEEEAESEQEITDEQQEDQAEPDESVEEEPKDELDKIAQEVLEEQEEEEETEDEGMVTFEGDPEDGPTTEEETTGEETGAIQDMLEQEAERSQGEEEELSDEELPDEYLTVEQLPEHEEFKIPDWFKKSGYYLLTLIGVVGLIWFFLMPIWETFLTNRIENDITQEHYESAQSWARWGLILNGWTIKYDDVFLGYYLKLLLDRNKLQRFQNEYETLKVDPPGPRVLQTYVEYLTVKGQWEKVLKNSSRLQEYPSTRGIGFLFEAKALLETGKYESSLSNLERAQKWIGNHPGSLRIERDVRMRQDRYQLALSIANDIRNLVNRKTNEFETTVNDYYQLSRIHRQLNKHRVSQRMLERALDLDSTHEKSLERLSSIYVLQGRWNAAKPLVEGTDRRKGFRELYPFRPQGWWTGSEISSSNGNLNKGIRMIERAHELEPRNKEVQRVFGEIYLNELSSPSLAVKHLELSKKYGMERLRFENKLAEAYYRNGDYDKSVQSFSKVEESSADTRPSLYYNIATAELAGNNLKSAEKNLMKARELGYKNEDLFNQWGLMLEMRGKTQEAYSKYFEGIQWGVQNNKQVDTIRSNMNRLLADEEPDPIQEWLTPLRTDLDIPHWRSVNSKN